MLNNEKITLMTKLALYEQKNNKEIKSSRYFKSDYLALKMLGSFACITFGYLLIIALWVLYMSNDMITKITTTSSFVVLVLILILVYIIVATIYMIFSYMFFSHKFKKERTRLKEYNGDLKTLNRIQELEYDAIIDEIEEEKNNA